MCIEIAAVNNNYPDFWALALVSFTLVAYHSLQNETFLVLSLAFFSLLATATSALPMCRCSSPFWLRVASGRFLAAYFEWSIS